MTTRRHMLAWLAALALAATACSAADTLATVNGETITRSELEGLNPAYADTATAPAEQLRNDLAQLIIAEAVASAVADEFGVRFSDTDIAARIASPPQRYAALFAAGGGEDQLRTNALQTLLRDAVVPRLIEQQHGSWDAYATAEPQNVVRMCVRHIMVATEAEAEVVAQRLEAGQVFEDVRAEVSLDTTSPGGLLTVGGECPVHVGALGVEFAAAAAAAPLGEATGPVASNAGFFHVIVVEDRVGADGGIETAEELLEALDTAAASDIFNPWASAAVREADVTIASSIGRWSAEGLGIAAPGT